MSSLILTHHAKKRCAQRGIDPACLVIVRKHGKCIHRQGYLFYFMRTKDIPLKIKPQLQDRLKNMVVVTRSVYPDLVVTAYRNPKAVKNIKKKSIKLL